MSPALAASLLADAAAQTYYLNSSMAAAELGLNTVGTCPIFCTSLSMPGFGNREVQAYLPLGPLALEGLDVIERALYLALEDGRISYL